MLKMASYSETDIVLLEHVAMVLKMKILFNLGDIMLFKHRRIACEKCPAPLFVQADNSSNTL